MPGDSITIVHHDTVYRITSSGELPAALDTLPFVKEFVRQQAPQVTDTVDSEWLIPLALYGIFLILLLLLKLIQIRRATAVSYSPAYFIQQYHSQFQTFKGTKLNFEPRLLHRILSKYFFYYKNLDDPEQKRFLNRLQVFMRSKTFTIPAHDGYREMPILISASAIQLTFGLKDFLLPWYEHICVHPREYVLTNPLRTLAGNVTGKTITLSWKHFWEDYQTQDGVNVGLHEMAHALQMQHQYFYKKKGEEFRKGYGLFMTLDEHYRKQALKGTKSIYPSYALSNSDEFWACSIELFFEKPDHLKQVYPELHSLLKDLLRQDLSRSVSQPCMVA